MKKTFAALSILSLLTACGPEARPALKTPNSAELSAFMPNPSAARVYFALGKWHQHHMLTDTAVDHAFRGKIIIDGKEVSDLGAKEFVSFDLKAGHHEISLQSINDNPSTVKPKPLNLNLSNNTVRVFTLELFDEKSSGTDLLMGFGAIGGALAGSMAELHTEIMPSESTDILAGRTLVYYKKL